MLAASAGHVGVVRILLDAGADPARLDNLGGTAVLCAATAGHGAVLDLLKAHGARRVTGSVGPSPPATSAGCCGDACVLRCQAGTVNGGRVLFP